MTLRAFIVDDEPPARVRLRQLLAEAGDVIVVGEAADAIEARSGIAETQPDLVFLDIEMPQMSGTALAGSLPEPRPFVVFATAFDRYALDAFAVDATDYLVKPITRARLAGTLTRVRERLSRRSDIERDLAAASATQAMLLPRTLPTIDGYESSALTLPARGVGGDFFVTQQIGPHRLVVALGDVSGKGMPAGLVASSLQARLETARAARRWLGGRHRVRREQGAVSDLGDGAIRDARLCRSRSRESSDDGRQCRPPAGDCGPGRTRTDVSAVNRAGAGHPPERDLWCAVADASRGCVARAL